MAVWQVMSQLRILFTGVVYDTMARWNFFGAGMRRLTETEWVGLAVLLLAEATAAGDDLTSKSSIKVCAWEVKRWTGCCRGVERAGPPGKDAVSCRAV